MATVLDSVVPKMLERGSMNMSMLQDRKMQEMGKIAPLVGNYLDLANQTKDKIQQAYYLKMADMYAPGAGMTRIYNPKTELYEYRKTNFLENAPAYPIPSVEEEKKMQQQSEPFGTAAKINAIMHAMEQRRFAMSKPPMWGYGVVSQP